MLGQSEGPDMEDAKFLQECGIEIDPLWLVEVIGKEAGPEASNYLNGLIRIANLTGTLQAINFR